MQRRVFRVTALFDQIFRGLMAGSNLHELRFLLRGVMFTEMNA